MSKLGDRLRSLMEEKGVTAQQLAKAAGITDGTVNAILRGDIKGRKGDPVLSAFARVLDVSVDSLIALLPARLREAAASEFAQVAALVSAAIGERLAGVYAPIEAVYSDRIVVRRDGRLHAYPYTLNDDNQVVLGEPQEVIETHTPVTARMAEAASNCFLEAADADGLVWDATLIRAGLSLNSTFYPDAVLREAVGLFEGRPVFAKADVEHLRGDGKDVRNIVGWISEPHFVEGAPDGGRIVGRLNLSAATHLREVLADAWRRGKRDLAGLSIDADGTAQVAVREGRRVRMATAIKKVNSVDLIVEPGAGGALVRMIEAANPDEENTEMALKQRMLDTIRSANPAVYATIDADTITEDALEAKYREAMASPARSNGQGTGSVTPEELDERVRMIEARAHMRAAIAGCNLPQAAKDRLSADFERRERFAEADVTAAIGAEREYLARFAESGHVDLAFGDAARNTVSRAENVQAMLDAFFDPAHKDHRQHNSFKECYREITGDARVTGRWDQCDHARLREALGAGFRESLDSTSFGAVLGNAITRRMIAEYRAAVDLDMWRRAATVVRVDDFRTQERTRYGGYGDLPQVLQSQPYAALASPTDEVATYAATKRGGTEDVTIELVKNDDVGAIRRIPVKLGRAAKRTLAKFVLDFIRLNPVIYDGVALFAAGHNNLGAAALDAASLAAGRLAMLKQTELNSGDRLGIGPANLWVPPDMEEAAVNLFNRNTNNDRTFVNSLSLTVLPVWYWTDANDWAISANTADIPFIEVGFLDGNEEPELFVQDSPTAGSLFTHDKLTYKIRHVYGGAAVDFRGAYKGVVA